MTVKSVNFGRRIGDSKDHANASKMPLTPHARISRWLCVQQRLLILHRSAQGQGRGNLPNSYKFSRAFGFKQARKLNRAYASSHAVEVCPSLKLLHPGPTARPSWRQTPLREMISLCNKIYCRSWNKMCLLAVVGRDNHPMIDDMSYNPANVTAL